MLKDSSSVTKTDNKPANYLLKNIPQNLYRSFAAKCKMNGTTVRAVIINYMKEDVYGE